MRMGLGLGLTAAQSSGGSVDPDAAIAAILSDGAHMAIDTARTSTMWKEDTKATQVSAELDTIGAIDSRFGTLTRTFQNPTLASRPTWQASGWALVDGTAQAWGAGTNAASILNAAPAAYFCMTIYPTALPASGGLIGVGTNTSNVARFVVQTLADGSISLQLRRLDADVLTTYASAAGVIIPGNYYVVEADCDFAGTGNARLWVNGTLVASGTLAGAPVNTSATNSVRCRVFQTVASTGGFMQGYGCRPVMARKLLTDPERATVREWSQRMIIENGAARLGVGGATWFNSPDMLVDGDVVYVGTAQDDGRTSRFLAWDTAAGTSRVAHITTTPAGDDHDNGAMIKLADGSFLSASIGHNVAEVYIGRGATPFALTETGIDTQLGTLDYSYANLIQLDGETNDPIYLFGRGGSPWSARYSSSSDGGVTWGAYTIWCENGTDRPYVQYWKTSSTRIDFVLTQGHPDTSATSIYHGYYEGGAFYKTDGTAVGALPISPSAFTQVFDGSAVGGSWCWDLKRINGVLVAAFASFPSTTTHRYHIATLSGTTWTVETVVSDAGTYLYAAQPYYSGGICLHPTNPSLVYCSVVSGGVHQIFPYTKSGSWSAGSAMTSGAVPSFRPNTMGNAMTFIRGAYTSYTDFGACYLMGKLI